MSVSESKTFVFDEEKNPWQLGFFLDRTTVTGYTGGFGNGKTAALGVIAVTLARNYQNARILVGRATRPKLEDSTKPELLKWFPPAWVARYPTDRHNNLIMKETNSTIEFRHIRQEGKGKGEQQSNLLSATYDAIIVDQLDDPEFGYKDFEDLIGRLRGTAKFVGDRSDPVLANMPEFGPQWFRFGANPTRNWLYRELVAPYFTYQDAKIKSSKLLIDHETGELLIKIFNAPSSANQHNTGAAYVNRMRSVFRGANAKRFVDASWGAYEGLIFPEFDETVHIIHEDEMQKYITEQLADDMLGVIEGYDYGQASASCYLLMFHNSAGDIFLADGYYEPMLKIKSQVKQVKDIRKEWNIIPTERPFADPQIFKKTNAAADKVAEPIATLFSQQGLEFQRGANDIASGLQKCASYLTVDKLHKHPITGNYGAPRFFVSSKCEFFTNEIVDYYWNKNVLGNNVDKPQDRNDHAMNAWKYGLTRRPNVVGAVVRRSRLINPIAFQWHEAQDDARGKTLPRHT